MALKVTEFLLNETPAAQSVFTLYGLHPLSLQVDSVAGLLLIYCMDHIEFMRKIGALGGKQRKFHDDRRILAREAGRLSWSPEARAKRLSNRKAPNDPRSKTKKG